MNDTTDTDPSQASQRKRDWIVIVIIVGVLAAVTLAFQLRPDNRRGDIDTADSGDSTAATNGLTLPERTTSPFLNTQTDVGYVGSNVCADCHEEPHRTFMLTQHSRSLSLVVPQDHPPDSVVDHELSHRSYEVKRVEGPDEPATVLHTESLLERDGNRTELAAWPISYQIGSGQVAESFFVAEDDFLIQSPITWFARDKRWDISPGYDTPDHLSFGRVIRSGCLYCHTGHVEDPAENGLRHKIIEQSIGCERCHGPGERHVDLHSNDGEVSGEIDRTIVNPIHLSRNLSEDICAQCHLNGDVQVSLRGRRPSDYRPGLPLHEYRLEFREEQPDPEMRVAGHVEQLHQSRCYKKSETLTCVTCHQPHEDLQPGERLTQHRSTCMSCHQEQPCLMPIADRESRNSDNCIECHMPQSDTEVTHVALTHHRIGIHRNQTGGDILQSTFNSPRLVPLQTLNNLSDEDRNRSLGLAELKLVRMKGRSPDQVSQLQKAAGFLSQAYKAGVEDPEMLIALAGIARDSNRGAKGIELATQALQAPELSVEDRLVAMDILAELFVKSGEMEKAAELLREITRSHRSAMHWFLLGQIAAQRQEFAEAEAALNEAVRIAPGIPEYRIAWAAQLDLRGDRDEAQRQRELAEKVFRAGVPPTGDEPAAAVE